MTDDYCAGMYLSEFLKGESPVARDGPKATERHSGEARAKAALSVSGPVQLGDALNIESRSKFTRYEPPIVRLGQLLGIVA